MRIAIVGSGISGLVAGYLLHPDHEVTLFEAEEWVGGHTHTVDVELDGEHQAVDTGFIVYNERTYPNFTRLLKRLCVATQPSDMSFSVRCERSGLEWASHGLSALFAQKRNLVRPGFRRMLRDMIRFNGEAKRLLATGGEKVTLGDYLCGGGYSREFVELYVVPMGAAIWSADPDALLRFPAASFVRFFANHGLLDRRERIAWRVVQGGSARYVEALTAGFRDRIRLRTPVRAVRRHGVGVEVHTSAGPEPFDRVIFANHSDQALALLEDATELERKVLGSIAYQPNEVVLHTDASLLPRRRRAWASWNYHVPKETQTGVSVTYHMNRLQGLHSAHELLVSLNAGDRIDPARVLGRWTASHPLFDGNALAAQKLHPRIDGPNRTHFCGAYWGWGFHEDGVRSALAVAESFGRGL